MQRLRRLTKVGVDTNNYESNVYCELGIIQLNSACVISVTIYNFCEVELIPFYQYRSESS